MSLSGRIFKKRGPTKEDILREAQIKKKISAELNSAIKSLQQEHCNSGEPINSTETANHVCNVIEAVFLHGLKNSVVRKIGKYVGLQNGEHTDPSINFWSFANKFTHHDTTAQLTRLGQITTEIGLCRAWIRVALNDGLISSYVDSMMADKSTLQYYYDKWAYLLDFEQQEIFKSLLRGLMTLEFKLSYNSRLLNSWMNAPLELAGLIEQDETPLPVVNNTARQSSKPSHRVLREPDPNKVKVIHKSRGGSDSEPKTPPNTPFDVGNFPQGFTRQDVENIKNYNLSSSPSNTECSSSSHISCPDPIKYNRNPASYVENDTKDDDVMFTLNEEEDQNQDSFVADDIQAVIKHSKDQDDQSKGSPYHDHVAEQNHVTERISNEITPTSVSPVKFSLEVEQSSFEEKLDLISSKSDSKDNEVKLEIDSNPKIPENDTIEHSKEDQHARILADILGDDRNFSQAIYSSPDQSDSGIVNSPSSMTESTNSSPVNTGTKLKGKKHKLKPDFQCTKHESPPEISPAVANSIETSQINLSRNRYSLPNIKMLRDSASSSSPSFPAISENQSIVTSRPRSESDTADVDHVGSPSSVGNSLGALSGWSSSFQLEAEDTIRPLPQPKPSSMPNRPKAESFGSLLKNYTPSSSVTPHSLDDVLSDLPGSSDISSPVHHRIYEVEDDTVLIEGFELPPSDTDPITQSKLMLLGEIANEKGLDAQNYQCKGCTRPVGLIYGKPRVCTFDAGYYCFECHESDEYYIPAMVVHNWDFRKHPVSKCNYKFLQDFEDQSKLDISKLNPKLYEHVKEMADIKEQRTQLYYLKTYLFTCKQSIADEFRQTLWPREYFYENIHQYSLTDLLQVPSGTLIQSLKKVIKFATKHVYDCKLCSQKGYICELCNQPKVIYPFEIDSTTRCKQCKSVFHKTCKTAEKQCPKCLRKQQRRSQTGIEAETPESSDYAFVPQ